MTYDEWRKALDDAEKASKAALARGRTFQEIREELNLSKDRTTKFIKAMTKAGKMTVGRDKRPAIDGTMRSVPTYFLKGQGK